MGRVEQLSQGILNALMSEFATQKRTAGELKNGYTGVPMATLKATLCGDSGACDVDFDLALEGLIDKEWIGTGPLVVVEPPSIPGVVFAPIITSSNEFSYLKEKGYKAAQQLPKTTRQPSTNHLHISGATFNHSPIAVGQQVTQSVTTRLSNAPVFSDLRNAVLGSNIESRSRAELLTHIEAMEDAHKNGGFIERYQDFIACAANHMTLVAPFLPALAALLK